SGRGPSGASGLFAEGRGLGPAGMIEVRSPQLLLDQGQIVAETFSDDGGNLQLRIPQLILLNNQALISASAGRGSGIGNGGNINIDTSFLVAIPGSDSDIVANAFLGQGGNIQISALGILQIEPRQAILGNGTNDIDASSAFGQNGTVTIAQPDADPSRGLGAATPEFVDVSRLVAQGCQSGGGLAGRLTVTGRGGVALDPSTVPSAATPFTDLGSTAIAPAEAMTSDSAPALSPSSLPVEAQGWVVDDQGEVVLIAQAARGELALGEGSPASCVSQF
ncbi:MAG: filamentous hemagglutinin, partial [Leptolyngbya sp.]